MESEFTMNMPASQEPEIAANVSNDSEMVTPRRILVVDDSEASAWTLGLALELAGHKTELAHDMQGALEKARTFIPEVILLDIGIPGTSGYDICKTLRQYPEMKHALIIAQTGWGQDEHRELSKTAGFDHHLVKPVDLHKIKELIASHPILEKA